MHLLSIQYLCIILFSKIHPFHVSVCEIFHNSDSKTLEISLKIFIDDFELAIHQNGNNDFILSDATDKKILWEYLADQFIIEVNDRNIPLSIVGFELRNDAVICYIMAQGIYEIDKLRLENKVLTEVFEDQINLTHFQYKGEMKSLQTSGEIPFGMIDTSSW
jgi:hypothetical protein